jgi:hypothetical protein
VWLARVAVFVTRLRLLVILPDTAPVYGIVVPGAPVGTINSCVLASLTKSAVANIY